LTAFPQLSLVRLVSEPGLSRARNRGLSVAKGDIIGFPDDDCLYAPDLLEKVVNCFEGEPAWQGIAGRTMGEGAVRPLWRWDTHPGPVTKRNVWSRVNSNSLFLRRAVFEVGFRFDEMLGVGAGTPWGSAEEVDLILSAIQHGSDIQFVPDVVVHHRNVFPENDELEIEKAYRYACGMGFVLRKHRYAPSIIAFEVLRPLASALRAMIAGDSYKARFMLAMSSGRMRGLRRQGQRAPIQSLQV
jgi:glycosyltransferase involved in cell wall biosynthesis